MSEDQRKTIANPISVSGQGLHSGRKAIVLLVPAESGTGVRFGNKDSLVKASIENLGIGYKSTTSIVLANKTIGTAEHILSALFGLGITDIYIEVIEGNEIPILDGSAQQWGQAINEAGIQELSGAADRFQLLQEFTFTHGVSEYHLRPNAGLVVDLEINFPNTVIGIQRSDYAHSLDSYADKIAWARTFIGDGANGEPLDRSKILSRLKSVDIDKPELCPCILYEQMHYITPLRHNNEPAVHKLLDFIGDLSLLGGELCAEISVKRPTHLGNHLLIKKIVQDNIASNI